MSDKVTVTSQSKTWNSKNWTSTTTLSNWATIKSTTVWWSTTYSVGWKNYSSASDAVSAAKSYSGWWSSWWGGGWWSRGWWSSGWSSSWWTYKYNPNTGYYERTDWGTDTYAGKWWSTVTVWWWKVVTTWWNSWISNWTKTVTGGYMKNWVLYNEYSDWTSWPASEFKSNNWSSNWDYISSAKFWQWTPDDYQKTRNSTLWQHYADLGKFDYNTIYNDLSKNSWFASASENDKRSTVNKIMEQAANAKWWTLTKKSDEEIAAEQRDNNDEDYDYENEIFNEEIPEEELNEEEYNETPDWDELMWDYLEEYIQPYLDEIDNLREQLQSNTIEKTVPEERDTSYDYNTYFQENLAPENNYENGESKNELANETWLTFKEKYEDPITQSLTDLWLLTPNEEAAEQEWVEEEVIPVPYNSPEEIVSWFEWAMEELAQEWENGIADKKSAAQTYSNFKNQLMEYLKNKKISKDEYADTLNKLVSNNILKSSLIRK